MKVRDGVGIKLDDIVSILRTLRNRPRRPNLEVLANPAPLQLPGSIDVNSGLMVLEMSEAFVQSCLSGGLLRLLRVD
jgi:hypothetical protein